MASYNRFAYIYDKLMDEVDYEEWTSYIERIFEKFGVRPALVADLACGTGTLCISMAKRSYEMIGIDISTDMLSVAVNKAREENLSILFLNQDICGFELYGTVDAMLCLMDSVNYILEPEKLLEVFKLVKTYLNPEGIFIFDINSEYKISKILGENTFTEVRDDIAYIWNNYYDRETKVCDFELTFFIKNGLSYERVDELHRERAYSVEEITGLLKESGLFLRGIYDAFSFEAACSESERIFFVCSKRKDAEKV